MLICAHIILIKCKFNHNVLYKSLICFQVCVLLNSVCDFRLGNLACLADPKDLLVYKGTETFSVIQNIVMNCSRDGLSLPSYLVR